MASTDKKLVQQMLATAAAACEDKKAEDIRILALDPTESGLTDYFLICTGNNDRQNVAITDEIEIRLKREFGNYPNSVEGRRQGEWILMDYVDFIVHVFNAEKRAFYGLERLRKTATVLSIEDLNAQLKSKIKTAIEPARAKAAVVKKVAAAKKPATTKAVAKKAASTKAVPAKALATKVVAPKVVATKAPAKAAKKTPAKKVAAKKTAAKKPLPKKVVAKKATAKVATKKPVKKSK
jgi:ribosome-associated protein